MHETHLTEEAIQASLEGLDAFPPADQAAILSTLGNLFLGFQQRNADLLVNVYASDADWVNAFGSVKKGATEIVEYLRGLFADANFSDGQIVAPPRSTLRRVCDDVAVVNTHLHVAGQGLVGGGSIPLRDNHSVHVLHKQHGDRWEVVSEMYMDVRTDWSYVDHS
jgi:uncharacterized protein (TIGR02246 family)